VLLLEAGGRDNWIWFHIPVGYLFAIGNPRSDWMFKTEAEPGLNGRSARLSARQGDRRLVRHQRHDLHARPGGRLRPLAAARPDGLGLGRRAAGVQASTRTISWAERASRAGGEWRVEHPRVRWDLSTRARRRRAGGHPRIDDFNTGDNEGSATSTSTRSAAGAGRGARLPEAGAEPAEPAARDRRAWSSGCCSTASAPSACDFAGRRGARGALPRRGDPGRRRDRLAQILLLSGVGPASAGARSASVVLDRPGVGATCRTICSCGMIYKVSGRQDAERDYHSRSAAR
jgi:choline dehydrogenase